MQAFARLPTSPTASGSGTSLIPGYSFNSSGYGYEGFIQPKGQHENGEGAGEDGGAADQVEGGGVEGQQMEVGIRSQAVEDLYAVPENYLEIEGELFCLSWLARCQGVAMMLMCIHIPQWKQLEIHEHMNSDARCIQTMR
jgi:hypothetical protein